MMIDLINMQSFQMDNTTWQASVGSGFRLDGLDKLLHTNGGRAIAHGTCPGVGVGGHATVVSNTRIPCPYSEVPWMIEPGVDMFLNRED